MRCLSQEFYMISQNNFQIGKKTANFTKPINATLNQKIKLSPYFRLSAVEHKRKIKGNCQQS